MCLSTHTACCNALGLQAVMQLEQVVRSLTRLEALNEHASCFTAIRTQIWLACFWKAGHCAEAVLTCREWTWSSMGIPSQASFKWSCSGVPALHHFASAAQVKLLLGLF